MYNSSLNHINQLPSIYNVYLHSQSLALLDAIFCPEWEDRYFSFNQYWYDNQAMASMRDGLGSEYFILFGNLNSEGETYAIGKVYDNELQASQPDVSDLTNNQCFIDFYNEPAFSNDKASAFFYRFKDSNDWQITPLLQPIPFLGFITNKASVYVDWAENYYDINISDNQQMVTIISDIFKMTPLTAGMVQMLNPYIDINDLQDDISEIGYPVHL